MECHTALLANAFIGSPRFELLQYIISYTCDCGSAQLYFQRFAFTILCIHSAATILTFNNPTHSHSRFSSKYIISSTLDPSSGKNKTVRPPYRSKQKSNRFNLYRIANSIWNTLQIHWHFNGICLQRLQCQIFSNAILQQSASSTRHNYYYWQVNIHNLIPICRPNIMRIFHNRVGPAIFAQRISSPSCLQRCPYASSSNFPQLEKSNFIVNAVTCALSTSNRDFNIPPCPHRIAIYAIDPRLCKLDIADLEGIKRLVLSAFIFY